MELGPHLLPVILWMMCVCTSEAHLFLELFFTVDTLAPHEEVPGIDWWPGLGTVVCPHDLRYPPSAMDLSSLWQCQGVNLVHSFSHYLRSPNYVLGILLCKQQWTNSYSLYPSGAYNLTGRQALEKSQKYIVVPPYLWFHFPWFQLLVVNYGPKILNRIPEINNLSVLNLVPF